MSEDLSIAKRDIAGAIDHEVQNDERIIEGDVDREMVKANQALTADGSAAVQDADTKIANTTERLE